MRSIGIAMTWEFWRRSRWRILSAITAMACFTTVMYGKIPSTDAETNANIHYLTLMYEFIGFTYMMVICQFDQKTKRIGFSTHLYLKPTPTWALVGWQMLLPIATITFIYLFSVGCARILFGIAWPIVGPVLLLAAALACIGAINWSMVGFQILRLGTCVLVLAAFHAWLFSHYGPIIEYPDTSNLQHMWLQTSPGEILAMLLSLIAAYIIALIGVTRDRRGDCVGWPVLKQSFSRDIASLLSRSGPLRSPAAAQFWYEWREKAWLIPAISGIFVAIITLLCAFGISDAEITMDVSFGMFLFIPGALCFVGFMMGPCNRGSKIPTFKAIRPVTNSQLSTMILKPALMGALLALAILIFGLLLNSGWLYMFGQSIVVTRHWHKVFDIVQKFGYVNISLMLSLAIICSLGLMGLGASLTFMGRPRLLIALWLLVFIILPLLNRFNIIPHIVSSSLPWAIGIASTLGTILAFIAARRRGLVSGKTVWLGAVLWLTLCAIVGFYIWHTDSAALEPAWLSKIIAKPSFIILGLGLLALPSAPLATAPLALAWNRHR